MKNQFEPGSFNPFRLSLLAIVYSLISLIGVWSFCLAGFFKCTVADHISFSEAFVPGAIMVFALFVAGVIVSSLIYSVYRRLRNNDGMYARFLLLLSGVLIGTLPRVVLTAVVGRYPENYYPNIEYLLFMFAGLLVAIACPILFNIRDQRQNKK